MNKKNITVKLSRRDVAYIISNLFLDTIGLTNPNLLKFSNKLQKKLTKYLDFDEALKIYDRLH